MRQTTIRLGVTAFLVLLLISGLVFACQKGPAPAPSPTPAPAPKPSPAPAPAPAPSPTPAPAPKPSPAPAAKPPAAPGQIVWKLDTVMAPGRVDTVYVEQACAEILELSEGRLRIDVYPALSLGLKVNTIFSNMKAGLCEIAQCQWQAAEGEEPSFSVVESAGIWDTREQAAAACQALLPFKKKVLDEVWNIHFIAPVINIVKLNQVFNNVKPIKTLDDFKGLKIRVPSARLQEKYKALGAAPQVMPLPEVYMGLKTGIVDGIRSASCAVVASKMYEVLKYGTDLGATEGVQLDIVASKKAWDALPPDLQDTVTRTFNVFSKRQETMALDGIWDVHFKRVCEQNGIKFDKLSASDMAKLKDICMKIHMQFVESGTPRTKEAWEIIKPIVLGK